MVRLGQGTFLSLVSLAGCGDGRMLPDAAIDAGTDAGSTADASAPDAGTPPAAPLLRWPANGAYTGSPWADLPDEAEQPLRPTLIWETVEDASRYRVQMEQDCAPPFEACAFDDPEVDAESPEARFRPPEALDVSRSAPVGRRYHWRVSACNDRGCSPFSAIRYLNVGRMPDDYDGDGFADVIVGAAAADGEERSDAGAIYVFAGSSDGLSEEPLRIGSPSDERSHFGHSVAAAGDVDADGFADAVVGYGMRNADPDGLDNPRFGDDARLFLGSADGLSASVPIAVGHEDGLLLSAPTVFGTRASFFNTVVARAGDVDADGHDDFLVSVVAHDSDAEYPGHVFVYLGDAAGGARTPSSRLDNPDPAMSVGVNVSFGHAMAGGDLDGDGYSDVAVAAPDQDRWSGVVYVYRGRRDDRERLPAFRLIEPMRTVVDRFGYAVDGGADADGDGFADLLVGAREHDAAAYNGGAAFVFPGSRAGPIAPPLPRLNPDANDGNQLGFHVGCGDMNGDGEAEVIASAIGQGNPATTYGAGAILVAFGPQNDDPASTLLLADPDIGEAGYLGYGMTVADINGDGFADVVAATASTGRVVTFHGSPGHPAADPTAVRLLGCRLDREGCGFGIAVD